MDSEPGWWSSTEAQDQDLGKGDLGYVNRIDATFQLKERKGALGLRS